MERLSLLTAREVQTRLAASLRERRRLRNLSRTALAAQSTVPPSTIKRFETTGQISLRQFLLLWQCVDRLDRVATLAEHPEPVPSSIEEVLADEPAIR